MIVTEGVRFSDYGLYLLKEKPVLLYNYLDLRRLCWEERLRLAPGKCTMGYRSSPGRVTPGDCSPEVPTDRDMRNCRVRLFATRLRYVAGERMCGCGSR